MRAFLTVLILAGVVVGLSGCRGDKGNESPIPVAQGAFESSPASRPALADRQDQRPLLVCFGDSLTAGYGADEGDSYPDFLQHDLDRLGYHYRVVNEGISGNTTKDGVDRLPGIESMKAAVVVVEFGGNDGLRGLKVDTTRSNLSTIISGLKASGARVVLAGITLPPDYGLDYVTSFTATYPTLGKKYSVPVLPFILKGVYGVPGLMQADNIHATNQGNEIVARNILQLVEPLLRK